MDENLLVEHLRQLCKRNRDIDGAAILLRNSKIIAERFGKPDVQEKLGLLLSLLQKMPDSYSDAIPIGRFRELQILGKQRSALVFPLHDALLMITAKKGANIGLINIDCRAAVAEINSLLVR